MHPSEKVSIVVPLYNRVAMIGQTINSVLSQAYSHWELIVVDDHSTDGSYELVEKIAKTEVRIQLLKRNRLPKGAPTCRNIGAAAATGKYLIFLDSDDLLAPFCLEKRVELFLENPDFDFLVFPILLFSKEPYDRDILWNIDDGEDDLLRFLRGDAVWQTTCPIYRREAFLKTEGFDESLTFWQDYELHIRLLITGLRYKKLMHLPPDCFNRRHAQGSISQESNITPPKLAMKEVVFQKIAGQLQIAGKDRNVAYQEVCAARIFKTSLQWIVHEHNLQQAIKGWQDCYAQKLTGFINYKLGDFCLKARYWQRKHTAYYLPLGIIYKVMYLLLPEAYRVSKSTLCKVSIRNAK